MNGGFWRKQTLQSQIANDQNWVGSGSFAGGRVNGSCGSTNPAGLLSSQDVMIYRENRALILVLANLSGHVVVGHDTVGQLVADRHRAAGDTFVVVTAVDSFGALASSRKFYTVSGNAGTHDTVLAAARFDCARALVDATSNTSQNLVITLSAQAANPRLAIAVYGDSAARKALLERARASIVISADELTARALVSHLPECLATVS